MEQGEKILVLFDFDGTITCKDSLIPFLRFISTPFEFYRKLLVVSPYIALYLIGVIPNWKAKQKLISSFLKGKKVEAIQAMAVEFAKNKLSAIIRDSAMKKLAFHLQSGHEVFLISASPEIYLRPFAEQHGIPNVIGTKLQSEKEFFTGFFNGINCHGIEKVNRLKAELGDLSKWIIHAYGDSKGDHYLLNIAKHKNYRVFH